MAQRTVTVAWRTVVTEEWSRRFDVRSIADALELSESQVIELASKGELASYWHTYHLLPELEGPGSSGQLTVDERSIIRTELDTEV